MTEGLELSQLWAQFRADATSSYRLYSRDFRARPRRTVQRHGLWHNIQDFAWAILEKLTPARRVLLLLAVLLLLFGSGPGYSYQDKNGSVTVGTFPSLQFWGGAILFVLLMLEVADRVTMKRDLEIARDIQRWLLPATAPQVPGLAIAFATRAANTVAGDYYDVFARPEPGSREPHFLLAIADVAGKSIPAALLMATFQASLRTLAGAASSLTDLVAGMNRYACTNSQGGLRFTTAFLADFNPSDKSLAYINAGHNAPILRHQNGTIERLTSGGLPLGIQSEQRYDSGSVSLQPGDWVIVFTDGVVEALNLREEEYGEARLFEVLNTSAEVMPDELLRRIMASVDAFVGATPQHDDITCMLVKVV
ncbi:MAG TPA: PP2C family protein-serine/threonine phosphatase [Terriglobales bacterium]|nr:PP2C family protein-serine/threonine phosphatase [Terriglobales bacterium]